MSHLDTVRDSTGDSSDHTYETLGDPALNAHEQGLSTEVSLGGDSQPPQASRARIGLRQLLHSTSS